jgi:prepilin-type N-terminal cleavage/methylation domain-containing protein
MNPNPTAINAADARNVKDAPRRAFTGRAFTLVEILTAVVIIAILIALLLLGINHVTARAKTDKTRTVLASLKGMLTEFETKGGRMRMIDQPYYKNKTDPWQVVIREIAPKGKMDDGQMDVGGNLTNVATTLQFERTRRVVQALLTIQANQSIMNNLPEDVRMKDPPRGGTSALPITAPVLLDGWGNPILFAPRRAKPSPNPENQPGTGDLIPGEATLKWGLQGLFIKANPGVEHFYEPTDAKGMFVSAGPDRDFSTADDNIYSDDSGKVYTDVLTKKP